MNFLWVHFTCIIRYLKALVNEDTLLPMMFLGLCKLRNICCRHKMFLNKIRNIFCVRNKCCLHRQTGKHLCWQQCVHSNVSLLARALSDKGTIHATHFLQCQQPMRISHRSSRNLNFTVIIKPPMLWDMYSDCPAVPYYVQLWHVDIKCTVDGI